MKRFNAAVGYRFAVAALLGFLLLCGATRSGADARENGELGIEAFRQGRLIESMDLLQRASVAGYAPAQVTLAYILDVSERDTEAVHWYRQAAQAGNPAGLFGLGSMYAKGEGVELDAVEAGDLTRRAALLDHLPAMRAYAIALEHGTLGFVADHEAAARWFLRAANAGDAVSIRRLRDAYRHGELGFAADPIRASDWEGKILTENQPTG